MKITLRKANAIQNSINEVVRGIAIDSTIRVNEFQDPEAEIAKTAAKVKTDVNRRVALNNALYEIRKAVGVVNAQNVSERLAEVARIEKEIQFFNSLTENKARETAEVIRGKLDKIRNRKDDSRASIYGRDEEVATSVFTEDDIKSFKAAVAENKKAKQKIQDEILELNVKSEITLSETTVQTLKGENLI